MLFWRKNKEKDHEMRYYQQSERCCQGQKVQKKMVEMRPVIKDQLLNMGQSQDFSSRDNQIDWV